MKMNKIERDKEMVYYAAQRLLKAGMSSVVIRRIVGQAHNDLYKKYPYWDEGKTLPECTKENIKKMYNIEVE